MATFIAAFKREESRTIIIKSNVLIGLLALTGFTDDSNDPVGSAVFVKTFRYSTNGVIFTDWIPLTVQAVTNIQLDPNDRFVIEISYFKDEPVGDSVLDVDAATLTATTQAFDPKPFFDNSLFKKYFDFYDTEVLNWYINVLTKLWQKGLIPNYLTRDKNDPDDFLALFGSVAKFFAYYVKLARVYATFYNNEDLLKSFLEQRGINISPEDSLNQLQEMMQTFYAQMGLRGSNDIQRETNGTTINGEFRRLIHQQDVDEFLFCLYRPENFGWCLGYSSPLYRGLRVNDNLNKVPWSKSYTSMEAVDPFITGTGAVVTESSNKVLSVNPGGVQVTLADSILVNPMLDYEISFQIKLAAGKKVSLSLSGFKADNTSVSFKSRKDGSSTSTFFTNAVLSRSDKYVTVKCYLYNFDRSTFADDTTNIRQGNNLIALNTLNKIGLTLSTDGQAYIYDFKVLPMMTEYSRGFLQVRNFISTWLSNRNTRYSILELEDYASRYLIPYNSHIKITNIGDYLYDAVDEEIDETVWIGAGEYCQKVVWIGVDPACETVNFIWVPEEETAYCEQSDGSLPPLPPAPSALRLLFDNIAFVPVVDASNVSNWNTFFDTGVYATTPFSSVIVIGNEVQFFGATGLTLKTLLFQGNSHIVSIIDETNCITSIGNTAFNNCSSLITVNLPIVTSIGSNAFSSCHVLTTANFTSLLTVGFSAFSFCEGLTTLNLPAVTSIAGQAFYYATGLLTLNIPSCSNLGGTSLDNGVFTGISGNNVTLTILAATASDADVVYLQTNNTVTLILV